MAVAWPTLVKVPRTLGKGTAAAGWSVMCQVKWVTRCLNIRKPF